MKELQAHSALAPLSFKLTLQLTHSQKLYVLQSAPLPGLPSPHLLPLSSAQVLLVAVILGLLRASSPLTLNFLPLHQTPLTSLPSSSTLSYNSHHHNPALENTPDSGFLCPSIPLTWGNPSPCVPALLSRVSPWVAGCPWSLGRIWLPPTDSVATDSRSALRSALQVQLALVASLFHVWGTTISCLLLFPHTSHFPPHDAPCW